MTDPYQLNFSGALLYSLGSPDAQARDVNDPDSAPADVVTYGATHHGTTE